jgi:CHRD domain
MHRRSIAAIVALLAMSALLTFAPAAQATQRLTTTLTGAAEVPGPGDPDGSGTATITINRGTGEICWSITVTGITLPASAAHIHEAPAGVAGPVDVTLSPPDATGTSSGCTTVSRDHAKEIAKDPAEYYVNVHNADFPAGALRGQLG